MEGEVLLVMHKELKLAIVKKARELNFVYKAEMTSKSDAVERVEASFAEALAGVEEEGARGVPCVPSSLAGRL